MSIDIHCYAEYKTKENNWLPAESIRKPDNDDEWFKQPPEYCPTEFYEERNYSVFAMLGNVKNDDPDFRYDYITERRGLPENMSQELQEWVDWWEESIMFPGWVLFSEIISFDNNPALSYSFPGNFMDKVNSLSESFDASELRLVFWFDI